jgi:hypothetical protein
MIANTATASPSSIGRIRVEEGQLWPIPTLTMRIDDCDQFNARLAQIVLQEEKTILAEAKPTNVAGVAEGLTAYWLNFNVLNWDYPEIHELRRLVLTGLHQWMTLLPAAATSDMQIAGISCWANVLRYGERLTMHHHDPAFVSAHYTVQSGVAEGSPLPSVDSGYTAYYRPGFAERSHGGDAAIAASPWDDDWRLEAPPVPGKLFFFPSFVRHEVRPNLGKVERISVAMDVFLKRQRLPIHFAGPRWFVPR